MASEAEDLEALFDSIADSRPEAAPALSAAPVEAASQEDELEALFDSISSGQHASAVTTPAPIIEPAPETPPAPASVKPCEKCGYTPEDSELYAQVGRCTRHLHDAMRDLGYDQALLNSSNEISSAKDRLEYVADLTEKAAVKVLNAVDEGLPDEENLLKESKALSASWDQMFEGKLSVEEFKALAEQSRNFTLLVAQTAERQKARMMDIMMAQDFQDITGQIIKKIVGITQAHEIELAKILREHAPEPLTAKQDEKAVDLMAGPDVPANALAQDDVDNLLADLGF